MNSTEIAELIVQQKANRRILIVEDSADDAILASISLAGINAVLDWAASGEEAQRMVSTTRYDLALVDIKLPVMNGLQFGQWLRANYPSVKIVLLTGIVDNLMQNLALDNHFTIMKKPMSADNVKLISQSIESRG